jgi:hypothetical protein
MLIGECGVESVGEMLHTVCPKHDWKAESTRPQGETKPSATEEPMVRVRWGCRGIGGTKIPATPTASNVSLQLPSEAKIEASPALPMFVSTKKCQ